MNGAATFGDEWSPAGIMLRRTICGMCRFGLKGKTMTGAMVAFGFAVAGTSMICYALMTRAERVKRNRRSVGGHLDRWWQRFRQRGLGCRQLVWRQSLDHR
jgi:hypothetical protein